MPTVPATTVTTASGRVSYHESGEGPPLVLLHSLLTDSRAFDRVIPDLGHRALALDLPGFGETDAAVPSIEAFATLMVAAVEAIVPDEPVIVMGNGLGSFVSLGMAAAHPDMVERLVLVGGGATFPEPARPAFANMVGLVESGGIAAVTPVALRRIFTESYLQAHPEEAEERAGVLANTDPGAFITACRALQHVDFTDRVRELTTPTLIVVGEDDEATPPAMATGLHELLPDSTMVVMPGVAHAPQLQDPSGFVATIKQFLEGE